MKALERTNTFEPFFKACTHRLFSYFYHDDPNSEEIKIYTDRGVNLFLDSGAFSAYTKNASIDIEKYAEYIKACPFYYPVANLDVIGDTGAASFSNMLRLRDLVGGERLMPVFHQSDDDGWLPKILAEGFDYIALGGLVGSSWERMQPWLDKVWSKLVDNDGRPLLKVHGFGLTAIPALKSYPWYSVDSSSWMQSSIYGGCVFFENKKLQQIIFSDGSPDKRELNSKHYSCLPKPQRDLIDGYLEKIGITAQQCAEHWLPRSIVNAYAFSRLDGFQPEIFKVRQEVLF